MRSTTASGETTNGTVPSSQAQLCALTDSASAANNVDRIEARNNSS